MSAGGGEVPASRPSTAFILCILVAGLVVRLLFAALIPLFPDEAYYWEWSRRLAAGYFDHPPGIALLVRAGTVVGGVSSLGVRLFPVLAGFIAALATVGVAWRLAGRRAALFAALIITCMPLAAAGLVLATPDAPLLATTALGLYAVVRALESPLRSRASLGWWTVAGVALGLAFCSKYTSILMPVGVVTAIAVRPGLRARFREPGPYVACIVATLIFLPVLRWNAGHDWVSFGFQIHHGLASPRRPDALAPLKRLGDLVGGQVGLVSPILFVLMAIAVVRELRRAASDWSFMLSVVAAFSFLFFCYSATRQRVEANWPAPAYIPAIPVLASAIPTVRWRQWLHGGLWLAGGLSALIYLHAAFAILPLAPRKDPIARGAGWSALANAVDVVARRAPPNGATRWIGAERYQDAAELAFHLPDHPATFSLNLAGRRNQYDLWPGFAGTAHRGDDLVVVVEESQDVHPTIVRIAPFFHRYDRDTLVDLRNRSGSVTQRRVWIMRNWNGEWPAR